MRRMFSLVLVALLVSASSALAAGRGQQGDWELGAFTGLTWLDDYQGTDPDDDILFGVRGGYWFSTIHSVEATFQTVGSETSVGDLDFDIDSIRVNFLRNYRSGYSFQPFWTIGAGTERVEIEENLSGTDLGANLGFGARLFFTSAIALRVDTRLVVVDLNAPFDSTAANYEGTIGVSFAFGGGPPPDEDFDGVEDRRDQCPGTPAGAWVDLTGCPIDSDGDGVWDGIDQCSGTPSGWPVDVEGCPSDSDGDEVADGQDDCPDTPEGADVDEKGCPSDADGDGVYDGLDRCADTPAGATVDHRGCPSDSDHDGVYNGIDACPETAFGVEVDETGCQKVLPAPAIFEPGQKIVVLEGVTFELNSADLTEGSATALDRVAQSLIEVPGARIEIGGHTDSTGTSAHNFGLSQRRADSVKAYLVAKGVEESRLESVGYGEGSPIADNDTDEGRARNRRVELKLLDDVAPPTEAPAEGNEDSGDGGDSD